MKKTLFLMSGCQASGKSYWVKEQLTKDDKSIWVSRDVIRFNLLKDNENYFSHEKQVYTTFISVIQSFLADSNIHAIYADATFLTDKTRKKFLKDLKLADDIEVKLVIMDTTLTTCLARNALRQGREFVPETAIISAWEKLERMTTIERIGETLIIWGENSKCIYN